MILQGLLIAHPHVHPHTHPNIPSHPHTPKHTHTPTPTPSHACAAPADTCPHLCRRKALHACHVLMHLLPSCVLWQAQPRARRTVLGQLRASQGSACNRQTDAGFVMGAANSGAGCLHACCALQCSAAPFMPQHACEPAALFHVPHACACLPCCLSPCCTVQCPAMLSSGWMRQCAPTHTLLCSKKCMSYTSSSPLACAGGNAHSLQVHQQVLIRLRPPSNPLTCLRREGRTHVHPALTCLCRNELTSPAYFSLHQSEPCLNCGRASCTLTAASKSFGRGTSVRPPSRTLRRRVVARTCMRGVCVCD